MSDLISKEERTRLAAYVRSHIALEEPMPVIGKLLAMLDARDEELEKAKASAKTAWDAADEWSEIYDSVSLCHQCADEWDEASARIADV